MNPRQMITAADAREIRRVTADQTPSGALVCDLAYTVEQQALRLIELRDLLAGTESALANEREEVEEQQQAAVRKALTEIRDVWQWKKWADAPRCVDQVQERIANAQFVTAWLTEQADRA